MSGTQKKPTGSSGFVAMTSPLGLNKVVNGIGTALHTALNSPNVKCQIFGLCEPRTHADGRKWPSMYNSTLAGDEFNLLPSDQWSSYIFFDREDPITYAYPEDRRGSVKKWAVASTKVALIFYGNLKWYGLSTKLGEDYRITKEELRNQILKTLWTACTSIGGEINPTSVYDLNITDVFKGFSLNDVERQYLAQPFYGLRIEMDVIYREPCGTGIGTYYFSATPSIAPFTYAGGTFDITITSNTSWTATDNQSWITITASGSGNSTLTITCAANSTLVARTGTVTITPVGCSGTTITVTQEASSAYLTVDPMTLLAPAGPDSYLFTVTSNTTWALESSETWATPTPLFGSGDDVFSVALDDNTTGVTRYATITVHGSGVTDVEVLITQQPIK